MTPTSKSFLNGLYKYRATLVFLVVFSAALWTETLFENSQKNRYQEGLNFLELHKPEKALQVFSEILSANPQDAHARLGLALSYEALGSLDSALQQFEQSAKLSEEILFKSYVQSGLISEKAGHKAEARRLYQSALKINPASEEIKIKLKKLGV